MRTCGRTRIIPALITGSVTAAGMTIAAAVAVAAQERTAAADTTWLIASAVLAAPAPLRAGAEVRGWTDDGDLEVLRAGNNGIICLADRPDQEAFAAACYHDGLEPFMERGRELRRAGVDGEQRNAVRWREIEVGTLSMPAMGMVYNLSFASTDFDPAAVDPATGGRLHAVYVPGATAKSTGLSVQPGEDPWLMLPGTPSAHIMITLPRKQP